MWRWETDQIGREHLRLREVAAPVAGPGEVVVATGAVALNNRDARVLDDGRGLPLRFPFCPGSDLAGTVVATGPEVTQWSPGDRVITTFTPDWPDGPRPGDARHPAYRTLGGFHPGVLAQRVALPARWLVRAPRTLDDAAASTLPCAGLTAWFALVERGGVRPGQTVLVEGTGGVAMFAIQIARAAGARVIVSGSADKLADARAAGAHHVVDRRSASWVDDVLAATGDSVSPDAEPGVDHVLEIVGGAHLEQAVAVTAVGGHVYLIGNLGGAELRAPVMPILLKDVTLHGIATGHRRALIDLVRAVETTGLEPVIGARYPVADLPAALERLDRGVVGKIVIETG